MPFQFETLVTCIHHQITCTYNFRKCLRNDETQQIYFPTCDYSAAPITSGFDPLKCQINYWLSWEPVTFFSWHCLVFRSSASYAEEKKFPLTRGQWASGLEKFSWKSENTRLAIELRMLTELVDKLVAQSSHWCLLRLILLFHRTNQNRLSLVSSSLKQ